MPHKEFPGVAMWEYNRECLEDRDHPLCWWAPHHVAYSNFSVGEQTIVYVSTGRLMISDKSGRQISEGNYWDFMRQAISYTGTGPNDPRSDYDPLSKRHFVVGFYFVENETCQPEECHRGGVFLGVSKSADPRDFSLDHWHIYDIHAYDPDWPQAVIPDNPSIAVYRDVVILNYSGNRFRPYQENEIERMLVIDKGMLVSGQGVKIIADFAVSRGDYGWGVPEIVPASRLDDGEAGVYYLMSGGPGDLCNVTIWRISGVTTSPQLDRATVRTHPPCGDPSEFLPQPTDNPIWIQGGLKGRPAYRDNRLWVGYTVRAARGNLSSIRFLEIDVSHWPNATIAQQVLIESEALWLAPAVVVVSQEGNVALAFSCGSEGTAPSGCYTGRLASDPPDTMRPIVVAKEGLAPLEYEQFDRGAQLYVSRFNPWNGIQVDPTDGTAWILLEYINEPYSWATWVVNLAWETNE